MGEKMPKKFAIEFIDRANRIKGTAIILFLKNPFDVHNLGHGKYLVSSKLIKYLRKKRVLFHKISPPAKQK